MESDSLDQNPVILIVDDEPQTRISLDYTLQKIGIHIDILHAVSAENALELVDEGYKIILVITDFNMPGRNGIELIKLLKQKPHFKDVPCIMLTAGSKKNELGNEEIPIETLKKDAREAGASLFIVKPFDPNSPNVQNAFQKIITSTLSKLNL